MALLILFLCLLGMIVLGIEGVDMRPSEFLLWAALILFVMVLDVIVYC